MVLTSQKSRLAVRVTYTEIVSSSALGRVCLGYITRTNSWPERTQAIVSRFASTDYPSERSTTFRKNPFLPRYIIHPLLYAAPACCARIHTPNCSEISS